MATNEAQGEVVFDVDTQSAPVVRGETVSETGAARALADEAAAKAAGFSPAAPLFTIGTMVVDAGVENARRSRQEFEALPYADKACEALISQVKAEDRTDHLVQASDLRMLPDGTLQTPWNGALPMTERAFQALCAFTKDPQDKGAASGGAYLAACPPDLRAVNVNHWFPKALRLDKRASKRALQEWYQAKAAAERFSLVFDKPQPEPVFTPRGVTLRTRKNGEGREIFSTVGPRYGECDIDKVATQIMAALPPDARAEVTYDGYKARIDVLFHSNVAAEEYVAGEIFKAGLLITTADDGSGAIKVAAEVWRNLCLNLVIIDFSKLTVGSRRHIGETKNIQADLAEYIKIAQEKIGYFTKAWGQANLEDVLERYQAQGATDMPTLFEGLVRNKVVCVPGVKVEDMVERLMRAWEKEPQRTKAGVVNAVTRAAHEEPWRHWETTEELEKVGGELLFAAAWDVEIKEETDPFANYA